MKKSKKNSAISQENRRELVKKLQSRLMERPEALSGRELETIALTNKTTHPEGFPHRYSLSHELEDGKAAAEAVRRLNDDTDALARILKAGYKYQEHVPHGGCYWHLTTAAWAALDGLSSRIGLIKDQQTLSLIARFCDNKDARLQAVEKLHDEQELITVARMLLHEEEMNFLDSALAALKKLSKKGVSDVARMTYNPEVAKEALEMLADEIGYLIEIAAHSKGPGGEMAVKKLRDNLSALKQVFESTPHRYVDCFRPCSDINRDRFVLKVMVDNGSLEALKYVIEKSDYVLPGNAAGMALEKITFLFGGLLDEEKIAVLELLAQKESIDALKFVIRNTKPPLPDGSFKKALSTLESKIQLEEFRETESLELVAAHSKDKMAKEIAEQKLRELKSS